MAIDFADDSRGIQLRLLALREQYQRGVMSQADALLDREFGRLLDLILSARYRDLTIAQRQRAAELFREIGTRLGHGYRDLETHVVSEMKGYATLEADVSRAQVVGAFGGEVTVSLGPALPAAYVESIAKLPIQGLRIGEWFDAQARTMTLEAKRIIQQGLVEGKGPAEIARRIMADSRTAGPVLARRAKNEAKIIARTVTNAVQNDAALASYERLPASVSDSYVWRSVRDNRVSTICAALDGRVWRYDDPARRVPPAHPQCRSVVQALLKGAETTLTDQKGPVTMRDYGAWLMAQPIGVQNEILGATRAGLWRSGKMHLSDAIDAGARVLTLRELRAKIGLGSTAAK
jgi:SPP1 gp7 family putative phage head morphogenesis protein